MTRLAEFDPARRAIAALEQAARLAADAQARLDAMGEPQDDGGPAWRAARHERELWLTRFRELATPAIVLTLIEAARPSQ